MRIVPSENVLTGKFQLSQILGQILSESLSSGKQNSTIRDEHAFIYLIQSKLALTGVQDLIIN